MILNRLKTSPIKRNVLTLAELKGYNKFERILIFIEILRKRIGIERREINILDWGCGRHENVIWL